MESTEKCTVLLIDDEPLNIRLQQTDLEYAGYQVLTASNGAEGWDLLLQHEAEIHAILLDRMMPVMDGMQFMKQLKSSAPLAHIPVIMQTAAAQKEQIAEGIQAGVYYYLTKPYDLDVMLSVLHAAVSDYAGLKRMRQELQQFKSKLRLCDSCCFRFQTIEDVNYLTTFLANFFPQPDRVVMGLSELLLNAVEHGNLGISYREKTELNNDGRWADEVLRRLRLPENRDRYATVSYRRHADYIALEIADQGVGFDWHQYLDISPERALDNHGRGIALTRMISFDSVEYLGCGNTVLCKVSLSAATLTS